MVSRGKGSALDKLLETPTSDLLSRPWSQQANESGNLWQMVHLPLKDVMKALLGLDKNSSVEELKAKLAETTLDKVLETLAQDLNEDSGLVVKVKARGRKLYVGKGIRPGGAVCFRVAGDRSIRFDHSLNLGWKKAGGTPLKLKGGTQVKFDQEFGKEQDIVELTLDDSYCNRVSGQPDYLYFSVLGRNGDHSGELRLAFLEGGDVKKVDFVLSEDAKHWSQKVYLRPKREGTLRIRREVDTFHAIDRNVRWFDDLSHLDILSHEDTNPKHFGKKQVEIGLGSSQRANGFLANLKWSQ